MNVTRIICLLLAVGATVVAPRVASACGGFIYSEHTERTGGMSDQEVVVVAGETETVMVVSAGYVESAGDFAFLLPLAAVPDTVADGDVRLLAALDFGTAPRVVVEDYSDIGGGGDDGGGCGCGGAADGGAGNFRGGAEDVTVHERGDTATYEFVVLSGETGEAVTDWLTTEGFSVPADYGTALDDYVAAGWFFLAARIQPDVPAGALAPILVRMPVGSADAFEFPIGLSAHSLVPGADLSITLYVIHADAVEPTNYAVATVDGGALRATSSTTSNYEDVFADAVASDAGGAFVLEAEADLGVINFWVDSVSVPDAPAAEVDVAAFDAIVDEVVGSDRHIQRFRTTLDAAQLHDASFVSRAFAPVYSTFYVEWDGETDDVGASEANFGPWLLAMAAFGMIRRRR